MLCANPPCIQTNSYGIAGFWAATDSIIEMTGFTGSLNNLAIALVAVGIA